MSKVVVVISVIVTLDGRVQSQQEIDIPRPDMKAARETQARVLEGVKWVKQDTARSDAQQQTG